VSSEILSIVNNLAPSETKIFASRGVRYVISAMPQLDWYMLGFTPMRATMLFDPLMTGLFVLIMLLILLIIIVFNIFFVVMKNQNERLEDLNVAALAASNAKSRFLAKTSHEIRTPMNAIIGMSELAIRDFGKPAALEYIAEIRQAGTNLLSIINDILDFSKIEAGSLQIINEPYKMASLLNDVLNIIRIRLNEKSIEFKTEINTNIPSVMTGDESRIRQVLLNLLSNAIKFTNEGFIKFSVSGENISENIIRLTFTVADSGSGIKNEDISRLFSEFVRINENLSKDIEGTGLGLSITRSLCRAMGGDVSVSSEYGRGSEFTATIIQTFVEGDFTGDVEKIVSTGGKKSSVQFIAPSARILIVDDMITNLIVAEGILSQYKFQIDTCTNGAEAVKMVRERCYDFIMDHMMPGMDGIETAAAIRAESGDYFKQVPIIAHTANAISGMREIFLQNGFDDFLAKPIEISKLDEVIERWVPQEKREQTDQKIEDKLIEDRTELKIEGIDTSRGIVLTGGTEERYRRVLELYCKDASKRLEILRQSPDESSLPLFAAQAHALKSASASIGAEEISNRAAALEEAGKNGDIETIRRELEGFRGSLAEIVHRIQNALPEKSLDGEKTIDGEMFLRLSSALKSEDVRETDRIMSEIGALRLDDAARKIISVISDDILTSEFRAAAEDLDVFMKERGMRTEI
jgi:signal transduction histidine kinase/CheY-like chemotaxis protein/HPt (histidine-containing phosphotransfer) domain-containing protein